MEAVQQGHFGNGQQLQLIWQGEALDVPPEGLAVGRADGVDLLLPHSNVSRHHAHLCRNPRTGQFELVDRSTNGTYLQTEDGRVLHVHRAVVALWGEGFLSFGEPLSSARAVRFRHE